MHISLVLSMNFPQKAIDQVHKCCHCVFQKSMMPSIGIHGKIICDSSIAFGPLRNMEATM